MMWGWDMAVTECHGWLGSLMMIVYWVAVVVGVVFLVRYLVRLGRPSEREDSALEILRKRFAKGEISREEFEEKRKDLFLAHPQAE